MLKAVIFDWDGVIANSFNNQYEFIKYVCAQFSKPFPYDSKHALRDAWVEPFYENYNNLGLNWHLNQFKISKYFNDFMSKSPIRLFNFMPGLIKELSVSFKVGIATSNTLPVVGTLLKSNNLAEHISCVSCMFEGVRPKPHPDILLNCLRELNVKPEESVYVGDFPTDIEAARAAMMPVIAVSWGWCDPKKLVLHSPDHLVNTPQDLKNTLKRLHANIQI